VRAGLVSLLSRSTGIEVVGEAIDGADAVRQVALVHPDVVPVDIRMSVLNGIDAIARIRAEEQSSRTHIIMLTTSRRGVRPEPLAAFLAKRAPSRLRCAPARTNERPVAH
jgi:DNA-binding NarL/FixJ family response regulator